MRCSGRVGSLDLMIWSNLIYCYISAKQNTFLPDLVLVDGLSTNFHLIVMTGSWTGMGRRCDTSLTTMTGICTLAATDLFSWMFDLLCEHDWCYVKMILKWINFANISSAVLPHSWRGFSQDFSSQFLKRPAVDSFEAVADRVKVGNLLIISN